MICGMEKWRECESVWGMGFARRDAVERVGSGEDEGRVPMEERLDTRQMTSSEM